MNKYVHMALALLVIGFGVYLAMQAYGKIA